MFWGDSVKSSALKNRQDSFVVLKKKLSTLTWNGESLRWQEVGRKKRLILPKKENENLLEF